MFADFAFDLCWYFTSVAHYFLEPFDDILFFVAEGLSTKQTLLCYLIFVDDLWFGDRITNFFDKLDDLITALVAEDVHGLA